MRLQTVAEMFTDISEEAARSRYGQWRNQSSKRLLIANGGWTRRDSFNLPRFFHVKPSNLSMFFATVLPCVVVSGICQLPIPRNQFEEWKKERWMEAVIADFLRRNSFPITLCMQRSQPQCDAYREIAMKRRNVASFTRTG